MGTVRLNCLGRGSAKQCWAEHCSKQKLQRAFRMHWRHDDDGLSGGVPLPAKRPQLRVSKSRGKWGIS